MRDQQQTQTPALPGGKLSWPASVWGCTRRLTSRSLNGLASTAKTSLLRQDRVTDEHQTARLDVCRNCPGGHATFSKDGALRTCGPMLTSLTVEGQPTCGCVLSRKTRDVKQACPFGYWENADRRAAWASIKPRAVVSGLSDMLMSRRTMLGTTAAAGASLLLTQGVRAAEQGGCYIPITPCDDGNATHAKCSDVEGKASGDAFRNTADDKCYKIASVKPVGQAGVLATVVSGGSDDCEECPQGDDCCTLGSCRYSQNSTLTYVKQQATADPAYPGADGQREEGTLNFVTCGRWQGDVVRTASDGTHIETVQRTVISGGGNSWNVIPATGSGTQKQKFNKALTEEADVTWSNSCTSGSWIRDESQWSNSSQTWTGSHTITVTVNGNAGCPD